MNTQRRKQYLQEMGITLWRPHTALPGAKPSALIRRRPADSASKLQAGSTDDIRPRKKRLQSAASILAEQNAPIAEISARDKPAANRPSVENSSIPLDSTQQTAAEKSQNSADNEALNSLFIVECPGELLIVDSTVQSREHQQLLRNLMYAITEVPASKYKFTPLNAQQLGSAPASMPELAFGVVERSTVQNKTCRLLLLGDQAIELFKGSVDSKGGQTLPGIAASITVAVSYGSAQLHSEPMLKRETWAHVQCLYKQ